MIPHQLLHHHLNPCLLLRLQAGLASGAEGLRPPAQLEGIRAAQASPIKGLRGAGSRFFPSFSHLLAELELLWLLFVEMLHGWVVRALRVSLPSKTRKRRG